MARQDTIEVFEKRLEAGLVCGAHPTYRGLRAPRTQCQRCLDIYLTRKASGATERRHMTKGRGRKKAKALSQDGVLSNAEHVVTARVQDTTEQDPTYGMIVASLTTRNLIDHIDD
jgi:hypothetical protein